MASGIDKQALGLQSRRKFLVNIARTAGGVTLLGLGLGLYSRQSLSLPAQALRPPGVGEEKDFLAACIRCGLCVRDCPYNTLKLSELSDSVALGTPYFEARQVPCEMCEDIPCVKACPTGALDPELTNIDDSRMGLAVVVDQEACIAFQGLRCEVCFNVCPVQGKAITLDRQHNARTGKHALIIPVVHSDACTGCGKCEHSCILDEAAIKILPMKLAKGELGKHYRLGWKEKQKAGGSLVTPDQQHEYNLPEGVRYDYEGEGLIREGIDESPFSSNPLDTLNKGFNQ
ncbi:MAG: ferredoxin-type protein NapG [Gammaproteobacteria bacterium]|nr:ferredoxin-type protein NapG [Gammaproteobacteria bacterium]